MIKDKILKLSKKWRTYNQIADAIQPIQSNYQSIERRIRLMANEGLLDSQSIIAKLDGRHKKFKQFRRAK